MLAEDLQEKAGSAEPIGVDIGRSASLYQAQPEPPQQEANPAENEVIALDVDPASWGAGEMLRAQAVSAMTNYARWLEPKLKNGLAKVTVFESASILIDQLRQLQGIVSDGAMRVSDRVAAAKASTEVARAITELSARLEGLTRPALPTANAQNKPPPAGAILIKNQMVFEGTKSNP